MKLYEGNELFSYSRDYLSVQRFIWHFDYIITLYFSLYRITVGNRATTLHTTVQKDRRQNLFYFSPFSIVIVWPVWLNLPLNIEHVLTISFSHPLSHVFYHYTLCSLCHSLRIGVSLGVGVNGIYSATALTLFLCETHFLSVGITFFCTLQSVAVFHTITHSKYRTLPSYVLIETVLNLPFLITSLISDEYYSALVKS